MRTDTADDRARPHPARPGARRWATAAAAAALTLLSGTAVVGGTAGAALAVAGDNILDPGESLGTGQSITSPNGRYRLVMQGDGNLVEYSGGRAIFYNERAGSSTSAVLRMQADGNLVEYTSPGVAGWASGTSSPGTRLVLQDDANLVLYNASTVIKNFNVVDNRLDAGQKLAPGWDIRSASRKYELTMQTDGNLVLYNVSGSTRTARWNSRTAGRGTSTTFMQADGNLVVYTAAGTATFSTGTSRGGSFLVVQDDGNLVLYKDGVAQWQSGTSVASTVVEAVITAGTSQLGVDYSYGGGTFYGPTYGIDQGANIKGFDCSGLMEYAFYQGAGIKLASTSQTQYNGGPRYALSTLRRGDMVFYSSNGTTTGIHHVALYLGSGQMLESPQTGLTVRVTTYRTPGLMPYVVRPVG